MKTKLTDLNDINTAQKRLNAFGGEIPNVELLPVLKQKVKECEETIQGKQAPDWLGSLCRQYKL